MTRVRLASNSPEFSRMMFGTWRLLAAPECATAAGLAQRLRRCHELGITTLDTAEIYGSYHVEERLGAALALVPELRGKCEIVTKAGIYVPSEFHPERRVAFYNASADRLVKSAEKSLRLLRVEVLDLFLVHRPDWLTAAEETAVGLSRLLESGKVRSVGVSNYTPSQLRALSRCLSTPLVTNQVEFSPFCLDPIFDGTFDLCQEAGIRPMAWSPTGGGRLFQEADAAGGRFRKVAGELSAKYGGATVDQLCYAWILAHPARPVVILGTTKLERLASACGADSIKLDREDWYALTEAARGKRIA